LTEHPSSILIVEQCLPVYVRRYDCIRWRLILWPGRYAACWLWNHYWQ